MIMQTEWEIETRPRVLIAHDDPVYAAAVARSFRQSGWDAYQVRSGTEVRRLAHIRQPALILLGVELAHESGWLTCSKLRREHPRAKVYLISANPLPQGHRFARFVGALGLLSQKEDAHLLAQWAPGVALPATA